MHTAITFGAAFVVIWAQTRNDTSFLAMGIDEISVPQLYTGCKKKVRETNVSMIQNQLFEKWL